MKTPKSKKTARDDDDEMLPHYDFSKGEKPRYDLEFTGDTTIVVTSSNGKTSRKRQVEKKLMVVLDADVSKIFPDGKSVNDALRHLVAALPKKG